jgi:hydroxyacylglutathione hydrolase
MQIETLVVGPLQVNCYVIADPETRAAIIIDPGDEAEKIIAWVKRLGVTPERIVNTHAHFDHILAVDAVRDAFGIPFWIHRAAVPLLERAPLQAAMFGMQVDHGPTADHLFDDGALIEWGNLCFDVVHTPGHSPDGCTLLTADRAVCISGDTLFAGSVGRWDLPSSNFETLMNSLRATYLPLPDETRVYPGHGPATTMALERRRNPFIQALTAGRDPAMLFG